MTHPTLIIFLLLALLIVFACNIALGSVAIPVSEVFSMLLGNEPARASWKTIVFEFRLPKAITAVMAGAGLAASGVQMQTLFRNVLAGPDVLGISAGASLGVALLMLAGKSLPGLGNWAVVSSAIVGAAAILLLVLLLSARLQQQAALLIVGLMLSATTAALVGVLQYFSQARELQAYLIWTFGSLGGVGWEKMQAFIPVLLLGLGLAFLSHKPLNALLLGENYAASMGVNLRMVRLRLIISTSLLTGSITAFCGPIGFVGIAVPHLTRLLFASSDHRVLLPGVSLCGALLMLCCDMLCHLPGNAQVLPVNIVTSLFGAPVVLWIVLSKKML